MTSALHRTIMIFAIALLPIATQARAAAFCTSVQGLPDQCIYADGASCQARAVQLGGVCVVNQAEVPPVPGAGQFCLVVGNTATNCVYADRNTCQADAVRRHTACVQSAAPPGSSVIDPFSIRRPY